MVLRSAAIQLAQLLRCATHSISQHQTSDNDNSFVLLSRDRLSNRVYSIRIKPPLMRLLMKLSGKLSWRAARRVT